MNTELETRERQKDRLQELLNIKKSVKDLEIPKLDEAIERAVVRMSQEDIAWVEKIVGIKAIG